MSNIIVGKHVLESLSLGMYSNPFDIYREYIQNASDSIDEAYKQSLLLKDEGEIYIDVQPSSQTVSIKDNGTGLSYKCAVKKLSDVGNSDKDYEENRGFRGIGRLGGLGYANKLYFITSFKGENKKTIIKWDCIRLKQLLAPNNTEKQDIISVMEEVMSSSFEEEDINAHYFEVRLEGINPAFPELLDQDAIYKYLASVAAVDFDSQHFPESSRIKAYFQSKGYDIPCYKIRQTGRNKPIYKLYTRSLSTGMQQRTRTKDYIKSITFVDEYSSDGKPLYIGWLAITDFSGQISDDLLQGIRIRKGNILVGDNTTFSRFFPSEGNVANKMFAGEIHVLHPDIIPNAKRDDFEPGEVYQEFQQKLTNWADYLNRTYRRGSSKVSSAIRNLEKSLAEQQELESQVRSGAITSDTKRDKFRSDLQRIQKTISSSKKEIEAAVRKGIIDPDRKETVNNYIKKAEKSEKDYVSIDNAIVNADYATKNDLPSSYSKDERKVYQRVIEVIDNFFADNPEIASKLREAIKAELSVKKK